MVTLLFTRMADLFANKCSQRGLVVYQDQERAIHSPAYLLWCRKLADLTPKQFKAGMTALEHRQSLAAASGDDLWPPSYAQFRGLATAPSTAPCHKPFAPLALPDKRAQKRAKAAGAKALAEMKKLCGLEV